MLIRRLGAAMHDDGEVYEGQRGMAEPNTMGQDRYFIYRCLREDCHRRAPEVMLQHINREIHQGRDSREIVERLTAFWDAEYALYKTKHPEALWRDFLRYMHHEDEKLIEENEQWSRERYKEKWGIT